MAENAKEEQKELCKFYMAQVEQYKKTDFKGELQKLYEERKAQDEKANKEISELKAKLKEARAQLLESQKNSLPEVPSEASHSAAIAASAQCEEHHKRITELSTELSEAKKELEATKRNLNAAVDEKRKFASEAGEEKRKLAIEVSESKNRVTELEEERKELLAEIADLQKPAPAPVEEKKEGIARAEPRHEAEAQSAATHPQAQNVVMDATAYLVSGAGPESSKSGEENVGDEARVDDNRREDLSAESGSTALVEKGVKNEQKEGQYENPSREIREETDENDEPRNAGNEGGADLEELPIEEEIKEGVLLEIPPAAPPAVQSDAGQSPAEDIDDFFNNIILNQQDKDMLGSVPLIAVPNAMTANAGLSRSVHMQNPPQAPAQVPPVQVAAQIPAPAPTVATNKGKVGLVPDDLF